MLSPPQVVKSFCRGLAVASFPQQSLHSCWEKIQRCLVKNLEDFSLIISGLMDQVNREEASRGKQLLQKLTMGGNTIRLPPKDPRIRDPLALPSPTGTKRTNLSEINIPPALGPKTILSPGQPQASRWGQGQSLDSGLDNHMHVREAPQEGRAAGSEKWTD